jgi:hypothetical protein
MYYILLVRTYTGKLQCCYSKSVRPSAYEKHHTTSIVVWTKTVFGNYSRRSGSEIILTNLIFCSCPMWRVIMNYTHPISGYSRIICYTCISFYWSKTSATTNSTPTGTLIATNTLSTFTITLIYPTFSPINISHANCIIGRARIIYNPFHFVVSYINI